jgi:hypothetical protein
MNENTKIIWPSQEKIKVLDPEIKRILKAVGVKNAWVSDKTRLYDFEPLWYDWHGELTDAEKDVAIESAWKKIAENLGLDKVEGSDYIWQVAERMQTEA